MDGRGGCCIVRYASGAAYDMSKIDRIMLRFRPIAPKPMTKGTDSANSAAESGDAYVKTGRGKRRYARNNSNVDSNGSGTKRCNTGKKRKSSSSEENDKTVSGGSVSGGDTVVTLPLLPETPDRKDSLASGSPGGGGGDKKQKPDKALPLWLSFVKDEAVVQEQDRHVMGHVTIGGGPEKMVVMVPQPVRVVGTWVRVECITDTWVDLYGLGCTDEEKFVNLERDTCPGFLSDGLNRVQWTNKAYRDMISEGSSGGGDVVVWLAMKDGVKLPSTGRAFTCSVRLVTCGKEKSSLTLPCDVWRIDSGGFAWRLDIKAALSLGR